MQHWVVIRAVRLPKQPRLGLKKVQTKSVTLSLSVTEFIQAIAQKSYLLRTVQADGNQFKSLQLPMVVDKNCLGTRLVFILIDRLGIYCTQGLEGRNSQTR